MENKTHSHNEPLEPRKPYSTGINRAVSIGARKVYDSTLPYQSAPSFEIPVETQEDLDRDFGKGAVFRFG